MQVLDQLSEFRFSKGVHFHGLCHIGAFDNILKSEHTGGMMPVCPVSDKT